ncbi:hypothetical protein ACQEVB_25475 [Pseudonocardia sp. CA-107938]|uniref:hypothetical protein n=1 Tax=Pseudonocardia sp. CA-107938 TaxID=3240021 RepID=UPI003D8CC200
MPTSRPSRRGFLAGVALLASGCAAPAVVTARSPGLDELVARLSAYADRDQPYRPPRPDERDGLLAGLQPLRDGRPPAPDVARFGMDPVAGTDASTGKRWVGAVSRTGDERAWGAVLAGADEPSSMLVEVPHIKADLHTEDLGLAVFRARPGALLLIAGAHRDADSGRADVAHHADSLFHAIAAAWGGAGLPQLQLHGFSDDSLPGHDAVVSPGGSAPGPLLTRVSAALATAAGLGVCRADEQDCGALEGRTNEQGRAAAAAHTEFVHVELNRTTRDDARLRQRVADALAAA